MGVLSENFGTRVRHLRKTKGWTQEMLADKADMEYQYLGAIERGEKNLTIDYIERIASGFEIEPYQLFLFSTEGLKLEEEQVEDKIEDILKLCDKKTKQSLLAIIQVLWDLKDS